MMIMTAEDVISLEANAMSTVEQENLEEGKKEEIPAEKNGVKGKDY